MPGSSYTPFTAVKLALAAVALVFPLSNLAQADSFTFDNSGGTNKLIGLSLSLTNSPISELDGSAVTGYSLSFSTSKSFTGSLETGGTWAVGGTLTIKEAGVGIIFQGTFSTPVTWTLESGSGCTATKGACEYQLSGGLSGTYWADGEGHGSGTAIIAGSTTQIDLATGKGGYYTGKKGLSDVGGTTNMVTPVPEPQTVAMVSTGLLGLAFAVKRKIKGS
jgi:hypothetical protein